MTYIDISSELIFRTARSGGKGGQNVNKVETMVVGRWHISSSNLFTEEQKCLLFAKLSTVITKEGYLLAKSQVARTQLGNKELVIQKINALVNKALIKKTPRLASKPTKASKQRRLENKTLHAQKKRWRGRPQIDD